MSSARSTPTTLALAAAALFLGGCTKNQATTTPEGATPEGAKAAAAAKKMKCFGANECAGQSGCDVPDDRVEPGSKGHACGGLNECKGKGWILLTADECTTAGGEPL